MAYRFLKKLSGVFIYYLLLFALCRLIFLLYFFNVVTTEGYTIFFRSLYNALHLDISATCYLLFIPALILLADAFGNGRITGWLLRVYLFCTTAFIVLLSVAEIGVYREIHVKIYFNLLTHLVHAQEIFQSITYSLLGVLLVLLALVMYVCFKIIWRFFKTHPGTLPVNKNWPRIAQLFFVFVICIPLLALGCRGGWQPMPINEGEAVFCSNQCVNAGTINPLWNLIHSYIEDQRLGGEAYHFMADGEADKIVSDLFPANSDSTIYILKNKRPNVCFLILESWSADLVESCGGYKGLTPNFEKLVSEGYLFTNAISAGHVSDQGIPAILSGYPALTFGSAINQLGKTPKLPNLNQQLKPEGYYSSFFFGGQLIYGNIKNYIYQNGFDRVMEQASFEGKLPEGRLGIQDSILLPAWLDSLNNFPQPFFSCLFTMSTHSPYEMGKHGPVDWGGMENAYLNCAVYSDRQLGLFFEAAKRQPWFANTIFVIVADHSHNTPKNYNYDTREFYHIPLLLYGGALKDEYRGLKDLRTVSQNYIASTLLRQLQLPDSDYAWSKNIFDAQYKPFAFYTFNEGYGFTDSTGYYIWNKKFNYNRSSDTTSAVQTPLRKKGEAMLQQVMKDFSNQ
jgi:phosphoglycerol transferase MdoB-like AlkP superfamily enzyme